MPDHKLLPSIGDAKRLGKANHLRRCVILFETDCGQVGYASYGKTKALCQSTRSLMDGVFDEIEETVHEEFDGGECQVCKDYA